MSLTGSCGRSGRCQTDSGVWLSFRYYCDLSEKQVAEDMHMSLSAVKSAASRGLSALREHVTEVEEWAR